jgi:Putative zinc ribbon domain
MTPGKFCQSCRMPIDGLENNGSEKDGSSSNLYCKYCYQDGAFTTPDMTLAQMKDTVITQMKKRNIPENIIQQALNTLPHLQRWKEQVGSVL